MTSFPYSERLDYLLGFAQTTPVDFITLWESAADAAGRNTASAGEIRSVALSLISDMIDRGVDVGDSIKDSPGFIPWETSKTETLARISQEMGKYEDPFDYVYICWFAAPLKEPEA